ncbi:MAG: hypothetical protein IPK30_12150 [Cellvibrionales bacterium]|nr:hypothetical protein [Cellvibrionales bacterium]
METLSALAQSCVHHHFCGSGNNGGDVLFALGLARKNISAHIIAVGAAAKFSPDTLQAHAYATQNGVTISPPWQNTMDLPSKGIVVDALLGTGSYGAPRHGLRRRD